MTATRKLLRIATAGSVDDGKSTLIGRLLYETGSLPDDKLDVIAATSKQKGYDYIDFSLATDGLTAEREQGITIDVAHIYLSTATTNFIIADTPGHVEYTRNMVTGASTSEVAIVLIDARKGVQQQTLRHLFIADLLRVRHVVVAVNKMDLVGFDPSVFERIVAQLQPVLAQSSLTEERVSFIPISALQGDQISSRSARMSWFRGPSLLEALEALAHVDALPSSPLRFQVQTVIRPKTEDFHDFRGYAGKIVGGQVREGDAVTVLPSYRQSTVKAVHFFDQRYSGASQGAVVTLELADDLDLSRGDLVVASGQEPLERRELQLRVCHMSRKALRAGDRVLVQHGVQRVLGKVDAVEVRLRTDFTGEEPCESLALNDIGCIRLRLAKPLFADPYADLPPNGAVILIDEGSNETVTVGVVMSGG